MELSTDLKNIYFLLNESIDELSKLIQKKLDNHEIEEYKTLKSVYDKLKQTL